MKKHFLDQWRSWRQSEPPFAAFTFGQRSASTYGAETDLDHVRTSVVEIVSALQDGRAWRFSSRIHEELANLDSIEHSLESVWTSIRVHQLRAWITTTRNLLHTLEADLKERAP